MSCILSFQDRLDCKRSYADESSEDLLCEMGCRCDGTLYDCCLWDKSYFECMDILESNIEKHDFLC